MGGDIVSFQVISPNQIDQSTWALKNIPYEHYEVHVGSHYFYKDHVSLADGGVQDYLITTPDTTKWAHMMFTLEGMGITQYQLFEGTDKTGTTLQTLFNSNRNSANAATITIHKGTSGGTTDGTQLFLHKSGSSTQQSRSASDTGNAEELVLKQNTKYILRITSGTATNLINTKLEWYEHTNKI